MSVQWCVAPGMLFACMFAFAEYPLKTPASGRSNHTITSTPLAGIEGIRDRLSTSSYDADVL